MAMTEITADIEFLSAEIDRCNTLLISSLSSDERLSIMDYRKRLHAQLLGA